MSRRSGVAWLVLAAMPLLATSADAQAPAHGLRSAADAVALEDALLAAMRGRDRAALERLLSEEFEMVVAQQPLDGIGRDAWIDQLARPGSTDVAIRSLVSLEPVPGLAQVRFWYVPLRPAPGRGPVFVVDTWRREGERWQLWLRHAAPVAGSRLWIPGDSGRPVLRKMI